jgi:transglutaminase-like putative cysteine protease/predicted GH43/DUF377 family glycosyl hydrolase
MTHPTPELATRLDAALSPDPRRVIARLFVPGEDAAPVRTRTSALIERIARLGDDETSQLLDQTLKRFGDRHHDLESTFRHHYDLVHHRVAQTSDLSPAARLIVGAYFTHEYSVEAAALCNPSAVAHPDQSNLDDDQLRVAVSLRQIGEGHLSSIGFATAVIGPGGRLVVADRSGPLVTGHHVSTHHRRDLLTAGLAEAGCDNEVSATVLGTLPARFDDADFERVLAHLPADLLTRTSTQNTLEQLRRTVASSYAMTFPDGVPLHQRVIWPAIPAESNGMEDARFVRFTDDDGVSTYQATYTAYDGHRISPRMVTSDDLRHFRMTPMRGPAARNKGIALFPRTVGGRRLALCRTDGETLGLTALDGANRWQAPVPLHAPHRGWELTQVGNCGSPIETDAGWLVLTHGVGPMRRYAIGALLLDLREPHRVIAELPGPLLAPDETERDGYVPNVVYSCGGLLHDGTLWLPYGASDARVEFASVALAPLIDAMSESEPRRVAENRRVREHGDMPGRQVRVGCEFVYVADVATPTVFQVQPRHGENAVITDQRWSITPDTPARSYTDLYGNPCLRLVLPAGTSTLRYEATALVPDTTEEVDPHAPELSPQDLPDDTLIYTLPSRYCLPDMLGDEAWTRFGSLPPGYGRVQAICDHVNGHLEFRYGSSTAQSTSADVNASGFGVCRDFTHLAIAFCRALNIPARYVFGYLPDLDIEPDAAPMDFAAWMEVWLGDRWWTFDPRNNRPRKGRILIGRGRDASDVAMATTFGGPRLESMAVHAHETARTK